MVQRSAASQLPNPPDLARVLRAGVRNAASLKVTAPVREAVVDRLEGVSDGAVVPAHAGIPDKEGTQVQFLDRLDVTANRLFLTLRMNRGVVWWGIYFRGDRAEIDTVFDAVRSLGLSNAGWRLERDTGGPELPSSVWPGGRYVRAFRGMTADQVEELPTLEGLVSQIAADLWWWHQRLEQVKVLASFLE